MGLCRGFSKKPLNKRGFWVGDIKQKGTAGAQRAWGFLNGDKIFYVAGGLAIQGFVGQEDFVQDPVVDWEPVEFTEFGGYAGWLFREDSGSAALDKLKAFNGFGWETSKKWNSAVNTGKASAWTIILGNVLWEG